MKIYPKEIVIDSKGNVLRVLLNNEELWKLDGECSRCGKCCERGKCESYSHEILNGKLVAKCESQWSKPWQCKIFPTNPYEPLMDGCTYTWRKI